MAHEAYLVLAPCALRDYFPDKDTVYLLMKMWELPYVSLIGLEIQQQAKSTFYN